MRYRVEELARAAGVAVDTVRYYQSQKLLPPPTREKRVGIYGDEHLRRLREIKRHQAQGLSLSVIRKLVGRRKHTAVDALLAAVADEGGERTLSRQEVAERSGVPEALLIAVEAAGLIQPLQTADGSHYAEADVEMAMAGMEILGKGFPLDEILRLAIRHARNVEEVTDTAIELFDRFVRKIGSEGAPPEEVAATFRRLLPAVTTLVAQHFQRTLLNRALRRLRERGENDAITATREVLESGRLEVRWK